MKSAVDIADLSFDYRSQPILKDINLTVAEGEFLGLIGPNGCGKSTLLKIMIGLLQPQSGTVRVLGTTPQKIGAAIGYLPQITPLRQNLPVSAEEIVLMGRLGRTSFGFGYNQHDREMATQAMVQAQVLHLCKRRVTDLSGGEFQRVLLARALAGEPRLLVLDEPTSSVDPRTESEIFELLKAINEKITVIVVSHDLSLITRYAQRIACLNQTLTVHATEALTDDVLRRVYNRHPASISSINARP
jgi:zinc transport system ATP-binding protein